MVAKAERLTLEQMLPALPPVGFGGEVLAEGLADANLQPFLLNPELALLPESEWPPAVPRSAVQASDVEWSLIMEECEKGACARDRGDGYP